MIKKIVDTVVNRIELPVLLKAATDVAKGNTASDIAQIVRDEATDLVKRTVFWYAIWMNLIFGVVGFALGCLVTWIVM